MTCFFMEDNIVETGMDLDSLFSMVSGTKSLTFFLQYSAVY